MGVYRHWHDRPSFPDKKGDNETMNRSIFLLLFISAVILNGCAGSVRYQWKLEDELAKCKLRRWYWVIKCDSLENENNLLKRHIEKLKMDSLSNEWTQTQRRSKDF